MLAIAFGGCATAPPPTEAFAAARAAIEAAGAACAATTASLELNQAREKLRSAELASRDGEQVKAHHLAEEAKVDAQVAQAKASATQSRRGLERVQAALRALRQESLRPPAATPPAGSPSTSAAAPGTGAPSQPIR